MSLPGGRDPRSDSGRISVSALIGIALALLAGYLLLAAFEADTARYGSVSIPGRATVELPEGQTDIYYLEGMSGDSGVGLVPPGDLQFSISSPVGGEAVEVDARGGEPEETDGGIAQVIGAAHVPEEGVYTVGVESSEAAQRIRPALTFGQSPFRAIQARGEGVLRTLQGPVGIALLGLLVIWLMLPALRRARAAPTG